jgi:DNA primase
MTSYPRLSPSQIADTRARHTIVDVLLRAGIELPGGGALRDLMISCPCPGHADSTPSCVVHPATGNFYCFGCGTRGDVFTLVTQLTGLTSLAQVADLLDSGGPITPAPGTITARSVTNVAVGRAGESPAIDRTTLDRVLEVNCEAWRFVTASRLADSARFYLARRGVDGWRLEADEGRPLAGMTPAGGGALAAHLRRRGFTGDEILDAGWALRRDDQLLDRFRGRLLVPVRDDNAQVLGVIGRDVTGRAQQKYLNTAHTVAYHKGSVVYRPSTPSVSPDIDVIVCEGPLDALAIAAVAAQLRQSPRVIPVSPSGTALTAEQARQVLAISRTAPIVCADGDAAGVAAAAKWVRTLAAEGRTARTITLPEGHDPASWLQMYGANGLAALLALEPGASPAGADRRLSIAPGSPGLGVADGLPS